MYKKHSHTRCIDDALQSAELICTERKIRFTDLRMQVLRMIWENHEPVKAYDLMDKLKDGDVSAKPPTVYRTLDFLLENGLVHKINSLNAYVGCSHPQTHSECYFLVCDQCEEIKECCNSVLNEQIAQTASRYHFTPQSTSLEIHGICQDCSG